MAVRTPRQPPPFVERPDCPTNSEYVDVPFTDMGVNLGGLGALMPK